MSIDEFDRRDPADKPKGSLETAVALCDELFTLAHDAIAAIVPASGQSMYANKLEDIRRRRAALQPRLDKLKNNQKRASGAKP